jgi:hypothetical protein
MIPPPSIMWGCIGSLEMLGYEEIKLLTSSQEKILFRSLLDLSPPWGTLDRVLEERQEAGWITSIGQGGEVLVVLRDKIEN